MNRVFYRHGSVIEDIEIHGRRKVCTKAWKNVFDRLYDLDCIGTRLPEYGKNNGPGAIEPSGNLVVLNAVDDMTNFPEPDRRPAAIGHNERPVSRRIIQLSRGLHDEGLVGSPECTCGKIDIP